MVEASGRPQRPRPLSPHLQVWKWGPHMAVSIFHRATGSILAFVGVPLLLWFLLAAAGGEESYASFRYYMVAAEPADVAGQIFNILARIALVVTSWAFFQHLLSGLRHFVLDTGAGYEMRANKIWSLTVFAGAIAATAALWLYVVFGKVGG